MSTRTTIDIGKDFSRAPSGRFRTDGDFTGERFREDYLVKALSNHDLVEVILDGTRGYGSSFLEEAFGGLVRVNGFSRADTEKRVLLKYTNPAYKVYADDILAYIKEAQDERDGRK